MISTSIRIKNPKGLHARVAILIAKQAEQFDAEITIHNHPKTANALHIMELMMLAASFNTEVNIIVTGKDEAKAMQSIINTIQSGFDEIQ